MDLKPTSGKLATGLGLVMFMREQLHKPVPSPVVLGQITGRFRAAVKELAEREHIPIYEFRHKQDKDEIANEFRRQGGTRDGIVFIGVAQEKALAFNGKKVNGQFQFDRDRRFTSTTTTSTSTMRSLARCS